jgi:hypothetical protein
MDRMTMFASAPRLASFIVLAASFSPGAVWAEVRTWTDATGKFNRVASFQRLDGDSVVLQTADGKEFKIPLDRLAAADQAYAKKAAANTPGDDPFQALETASISPDSSDPRPPEITGDVRVVVAQGVGTTVEEAKKDAYREAVRQVVGAYVEGDTLIHNDELIEDKVLALSGALVLKADVIPESVNTSDGLTRLRIRAEVKVTEVMKSLAKINVTTTAVRTSDIEAHAVSLADQTEAAELALSDSKTWQPVPASFFTMKPVGQPKVLKAKGDDATVELLLQISPDRAQYMAFAKRLVAVLSKLDGPKGSFAMDGRNPDVQPRYIADAKKELWAHALIESVNRGNGASPEIAYAFPPHYREQLQHHFQEMSSDLPGKSRCLVYCFNQGMGRSPDGCGLKQVAKEWYAAIGEHRTERIVVCAMTQANESFNRTKWEWFTCDQSLFPSGEDSPWQRCIECEATLLDRNGEEVASDIIPLTQGFGISRPDDLRNFLPVVMLAPVWVETEGDLWYSSRYAYVPQFTFPRRLELSVTEAASISDVKCVVRPRVNKPD